MKFKIENRIDNAEQWNGHTPHSDIVTNVIGDYVDAETFNVFDDLMWVYYDFTATPIGDE